MDFLLLGARNSFFIDDLHTSSLYLMRVGSTDYAFFFYYASESYKLHCPKCLTS